MDAKPPPPVWRLLTPGQRTMLRRLAREGSLREIRPWEMRTVRSLRDRGLVRPRDRGDGDGLWFLTLAGRRILSDHAEPARPTA